jgi:hypothetical protein
VGTRREILCIRPSFHCGILSLFQPAVGILNLHSVILVDHGGFPEQLRLIILELENGYGHKKQDDAGDETEFGVTKEHPRSNISATLISRRTRQEYDPVRALVLRASRFFD